eukprot:Gregarina_sp_Poly_1__10496@NODE_76_length_15862_cov_98_864577_g65_i0_p18_GENE_NODE_76_length_15862_cov_98_864577_g65_i0NODE_76_length_15862_cov_98_864577_g65_i0_p18_ORF_typecomplete_len107_score4_17Herpes_V23/PF01802_17/0_032SBE2/PF17076_5/0_18_NODE_76_length_15862_cov_98_864577_g65_i01375714077
MRDGKTMFLVYQRNAQRNSALALMKKLSMQMTLTAELISSVYVKIVQDCLRCSLWKRWVHIHRWQMTLSVPPHTSKHRLEIDAFVTLISRPAADLYKPLKLSSAKT